MTLSAIVRSEKTSSATTEGRSVVRRHDNNPFWPSLSVDSFAIADSMSAAVVPGAKLEAMTEKGPALPFILKPRDDELFLELVILAWAGVRAEDMRSDRSRLAALEEL